MKKFKYNINNLDCANCARKIEETLSNNKELNNVNVNFNTMKLSYECERDIAVKEINDIIKKIEPDTFISEEEEKRILFICFNYCSYYRYSWIFL